MIHLTTQRLILHDWKASDLDAWAAINADSEVRRHLRDGRATFIEAGNEHSIGLAGRLGMNDVGEPWPNVRQFQRRRDH